jgi:CheY-like chemotaxis protein
MPHLDGVSATSLIRQFDPMTPIISMTSASNPNEVLTYFAHGMNDVLPKPFTKEGLLGMLEVRWTQTSRNSLSVRSSHRNTSRISSKCKR